jgi:NAD(P)H-dependent FMN reductase
MDASPIKLAIITGSTRENRFGPVVEGWFARQVARRDDLEVDRIDLAEAALPATLTRVVPPQVRTLQARLSEADAFVVVTPEYNHGYPAPLKVAIDWFKREWQTRPVGFVSYGGRSGGIRAVEQLRQVFAELHATTVRDAVSIHNAWNEFDEEGRPRDEEGMAKAADALLDQLVWWGLGLREARTKRPYVA